jgi:hypothetical protein
MNCEVVRLRLLSASNPARAPSEVRAHLADCEFCRDWHEDLCAVERHVPFLPVPRSRGKSKLLKQLLEENGAQRANGNGAARVAAPTVPEFSNVTASESPVYSSHHRLMIPGVVAGLAAAALLVLGAWLLRG